MTGPQIVWRPIDQWPGQFTALRKTSPFSAPPEKTYRLLREEVDKLQKRWSDIVIQVAIPEDEFKVDGTPKVRAWHRHPGVIVSFESMHGPLRYWTDVFQGWADNLRAIALGLEALRKIDRYGLGSRGEQYTGWKAIGSGIPMGAASGWASAEDAARCLLNAAGLSGTAIEVEIMLDASDPRQSVYRAACKAHHPDVGGDHAQFVRIKSAYDYLEGLAR